MDDQPRADAFYAHVMGGGKVEADDWMPDDYRAAVLKFVEMYANSELMGVLPECGRPRGRQDQVPQRLPLPDALVG